MPWVSSCRPGCRKHHTGWPSGERAPIVRTMTEIEGGLDEPTELEPEQGTLALAAEDDRYDTVRLGEGRGRRAAQGPPAHRRGRRRPGLGEADPDHARRHRGRAARHPCGPRRPGADRPARRRAVHPRPGGAAPRDRLGRPAHVRRPGREGDRRGGADRPRERRHLALAAAGRGRPRARRPRRDPREGVRRPGARGARRAVRPGRRRTGAARGAGGAGRRAGARHQPRRGPGR